MWFFRLDIIDIQKVNVCEPRGVICRLKTIQSNREGTLLVSVYQMPQALQSVGKDLVPSIRYTDILLGRLHGYGLKQLMKMHFRNIPILNVCPGKGKMGLVVDITLKHSGGFNGCFSFSLGEVQLCSRIFSCYTDSYNLCSLDASPFSTSLALKMACLVFILPSDSTSLKFRKDWVSGVANTVITWSAKVEVACTL